MGDFRINTNSALMKSRGNAVGGQEKIPALAQGFEYLDMQSLLDYCQLKLQHADQGIQSAMGSLDDITKVQQGLTNLKSTTPGGGDVQAKKGQLEQEIDRLKKLKAQVDNGGLKETVNEQLNLSEGSGDGVAFIPGDPSVGPRIDEMIKRKEAALDDLKKGGNDFNSQVETVASQLDALGQPDAAKAVRDAAAKASAGGSKEEFQKCLDAQIGSIGASREMAMVRMQALVSQRGTMLQMITNMISSLNQAAMGIAQNIKN